MSTAPTKLPSEIMGLFANYNAEMSTIFGAIQYPDILPSLVDLLKPECFALKRHGLIWTAILKIYDDQRIVDILSITEELIKAQALKESGGPYYLGELSDLLVSVERCLSHAQIVKQKYRRKRIAEIGKEMREGACDPSMTAENVMEAGEKALFEIMADAVSNEDEDMMTIAMRVLERAEMLKNKGDGITGIPTGFAKLDEMTSGLQAPDLIIVAARPGMGKTSFVLKIAKNASLSGTPVAFFSLEMSKDQLTQKLAAMDAQLDTKKVRNSMMNEEEWYSFNEAIASIAELNITISDKPGLTPQQLRTKCRRLKYEKNIGLIIIDYLQLMQGDGRGTRETEVSDISRRMKMLAKEIGVPIIALSQLSRAVETRGGTKRPQLSDLRESGAIEQDADIVSFIYRPEYYQILEDEEGQSLKGVAELIIAKHRNGELGTVRLKFTDFCTNFSDPDEDTFEFDKEPESYLPTQMIEARKRMNDDDIPY